MRRQADESFSRPAIDRRRFRKVVRSILSWKVALGVLFISLLGSTARANLITNSSFETPVVPVGGFTNFLNGSTGITGWTVVGPEVSIVSTSYASFGLTFPAEDGSQWLDLTGDVSNTVEGVKQTVATTPGLTYNLSYFVGNQVNPGGPYGTTSTVDVLVDGMVIQKSTNSMGAGGKVQVWEQFNTSFVATSSSTTIEFLNGDSRSDNTNGLDNIVLVQGAPTSTVPEPSTFILWALAGVLALGIFRFRKAMAH